MTGIQSNVCRSTVLSIAQALLLLIFFVMSTPASATSLSWIQLMNVDQTNYTCNTLKQDNVLTEWQADWCSRRRIYMPFIFRAANALGRECEHTFMRYKWNCTTVRMYPTEDLKTSTREQAVVSAFAAGIVVQQIVRGIRDENLPGNCVPDKYSSPSVAVICKSDYTKAEQLARDFLGISPPPRKFSSKGVIAVPTIYTSAASKSAPNGGSVSSTPRVSAADKRSQYILAHNYMMGIRVLTDLLYQKCLGLAPFCYYRVPDGRLGEVYAERYMRAMRVALTKQRKHFIMAPHRYSSSQHTDTCENALVFAVASHDYCDHMVDERNGIVLSLGTYHRECEPNLDVSNKCETFCCKRGYYARETQECTSIHCPSPTRCTCNASSFETKRRYFCNGPITNVTVTTRRPRS